MTRYRNIQLGSLMIGAALLAACGPSNNNGTTATTTQPSTPVTMPMLEDAFIVIVRTYTDGPNAMSETASPSDISAIVATSPEDTTPEAVSFP